MVSKVILLWLARKVLYVGVGSALAAIAAVWAGVGPDTLKTLTLSGAIGAVGAAVFGDVRRAFLADLLQIATGQDPRSDG